MQTSVLLQSCRHSRLLQMALRSSLRCIEFRTIRRRQNVDTYVDQLLDLGASKGNRNSGSRIVYSLRINVSGTADMRWLMRGYYSAYTSRRIRGLVGTGRCQLVG
jgi:hypothetical protein